MEKKSIDFMGAKKILFSIPVICFVLVVIFNIIFGVEMAIEFKGGTMITYSYEGTIDTNAVKSTVEGLGHGAVEVTVGSAVGGSMETVQIAFSSSEGLTADTQNALTDKLTANFKDNNLVLVNSQDVNPTSGLEFFLKCLVAVIFSFILLVIYIAFRFKNIGGLSAGMFSLVALVHDIFFVYAVFVILRFPLDANFMAVILTILGNSINNTIVVYDRVRENINLYGSSMSISELMNLSITQSLSRAFNTTLTTGFAILAICVVCAIFGVTSIMTFALPMAVGLLVGTYSSLLIAGPLWVLWQQRKGKTNFDDSKPAKKAKKNEAAKVVDRKKLMV